MLPTILKRGGMKRRSVLADVVVDRLQVSARFHLSTGRLVISEGTAVVESIPAPDSWMALAAVNVASGWGTRPTADDLQVFLERYVAGRQSSLSDLALV
ncbi:hypothetical protein B0G81_7929 [Paraburkholderia sp. BL6665CI2N2]|nr:hypothetical protein B0G81_7929 [Paraburkholderia sp. BL6665CI2N2]